MKNAPLIVDEVEGYRQVLNFYEGNYKLEKISAMPTYYFLLAEIAKFTGNFSIAAIRAIAAGLAFLTLLAFFITSKKIEQSGFRIKTLQFLFLPILFVFFFLIYTEVFSLLFVLLMIYFGFQKKNNLSGLFGILSMCVRQNNVMWVACMMVYIYIENNGFNFNLQLIKKHVKQTASFFIGIFLFLVFTIVNGGVAIGDQQMHPGNLSLGNIVFILITFFIVFLPLHIYNFNKVIKLLSDKKQILLIALFLFILFFIFFKGDHPYNQLSPHYFIRNKLLAFATSSVLVKAGFILISVYALLSLMVTKLENRYLALFFLFTILFLMPSWLIDVRYYVIPFTLFILFRKHENKYVDYALLVYFITCSAWVIKMARTSTFFI